MDLCVKGIEKISNVDDYIHEWHTSKVDNGELIPFLGMTEEEYSLFVKDASSLKSIVENRRKNRNVKYL